MNTNTQPCSGNSKLLLEIHSPIQATQFIMNLLPDTNGNAGANYYRSMSQQALETVLNAIHLLNTPYTLQDINDTLLSQEKLFKLKENLSKSHPNSPESQALNNLVSRYTTAKGFEIEKLKETLGGLIGRIHSFIEKTA